MPLVVNSISGNTNPFDPAHTTVPEAEVDATLALAGYARTFTLFERSAMAAVLLPMGRISGQATVAGVPGSKLNNLGVGLTLGYTLNDNMGLTVGYKSTVNDRAPDDLRMDGFMISLVYGWHPLVEGARRLKSGE